MNKSHLPFNPLLFSKNTFFKQKIFTNNHPSQADRHQRPAHHDQPMPSALIRQAGLDKHGGNQADQTAGAPTHFNMSRKPEPVSFYARYGVTLKGKQTSVRCCFHEDKTPSLSINLETGAFYCFGCGAKGGDVIDFYQLYHKCDFISACKALSLS